MSKSILAVLALFSASMANADMAVTTIPMGQDVIDVTYGMNQPLGRVWINVTSRARDCDMSSYGSYRGPCAMEESRTKVEGLRFDIATRSIVLEVDASAPVVCAKLVDHKFLGQKWSTLKTTRACGITRVLTQTKVNDDGYETRAVTYQAVYFGALNGRSGN